MRIYRIGGSQQEEDRKKIAQLEAQVDFWKIRYETLLELQKKENIFGKDLK